jgi:hypothetical protein
LFVTKIPQTLGMKAKRIVRTGDAVDFPPRPEKQAEYLLVEIARLYRERIRAHYNDDQLTLQTIADQIELLKSKLAKL